MDNGDLRKRPRVSGLVNTVFLLIVCIFGIVLLAPFFIARDIHSILVSSALIGFTFIVIIYASNHIEKQGKGLEAQISELEAKRDELENLVNRNSRIEEMLSSLVSMFITPNDTDKIITKTLEKTATICNAANSYLFLFRHDGSADMVLNWKNDSYKDEVSAFEKTSFSHFPWIKEQLFKKEMVFLSDESKLLTYADRERQILKSNGLDSIFVIPVEANDGLAGFISVESYASSMECCTEYRQALKVISELIGMALNNKTFLKDIGLFRDLINRSNDFIFIIDMEKDKLIDVNQTACQELQYTKDEFLSMEKDELQSLFDDGFWESDFLDVFGERYLEPNKTLRRKDGTTLPAELSVTVSTVDRYNYALAVVRDISKRKDMESIIAKTKEVMELALEGANLGMWDWNLRTNEVLYNPRWSEMLGYDPLDIKPHIDSWKELILPDDLQTVNDTIIRHVSGEIPFFECEFRMKNSKGKWQWILSRGKLTEWDRNGEPFRFTGTTMDVDVRKRVEEELRRTNELKDLFTDIMRHDLLNPAGNAKGFSEVLLEMEDSESKAKIIRTMQKSIDKLIEMIESAAKFAKLESEEELEMMRMDIRAVLNNVLEHFSQQLQERNMTLEMNANGSYPSKLNPVIEEVFANFISNAIKYSPENTQITIEVLDRNYEWQVNVIDCGEGISDKSKPLVFDRFKRVDKSGVKGTGLGLAIVKKIVELHGGSVGVDDNPAGQGSMFWVRLKKDISAANDSEANSSGTNNVVEVEAGTNRGQSPVKLLPE